jgi:hypothetical protein
MALRHFADFSGNQYGLPPTLAKQTNSWPRLVTKPSSTSLRASLALSILTGFGFLVVGRFVGGGGRTGLGFGFGLPEGVLRGVLEPVCLRVAVVGRGGRGGGGLFRKDLWVGIGMV